MNFVYFYLVGSIVCVLLMLIRRRIEYNEGIRFTINDILVHIGTALAISWVGVPTFIFILINKGRLK